jgi:hypothetical protein
MWVKLVELCLDRATRRSNQMKPYEIRIELTDRMVQELMWRALMPDSISMMPTFNEAVEQQHAQLGPPPDGARISGVSVTTEDDRMYAEISYAPVGDEPAAG